MWSAKKHASSQPLSHRNSSVVQNQTSLLILIHSIRVLAITLHFFRFPNPPSCHFPLHQNYCSRLSAKILHPLFPLPTSALSYIPVQSLQCSLPYHQPSLGSCCDHQFLDIHHFCLLFLSVYSYSVSWDWKEEAESPVRWFLACCLILCICKSRICLAAVVFTIF